MLETTDQWVALIFLLLLFALASVLPGCAESEKDRQQRDGMCCTTFQSHGFQYFEIDCYRWVPCPEREP